MIQQKKKKIAHLGTYPKELKTYVYTKTCTQMFTAAVIRNCQLQKNQAALQ